MKYYHLNEGQLEALERGEDVAIQVGQRMTRILTSKSPKEVRREELDRKYQKALAKLEG